MEDDSRSIKLVFHGDIKALDIPITPGLNCEDVVWKCMQYVKPYVCDTNTCDSKCGPMYLPTFGLQYAKQDVSPKKWIWLPHWYTFSDKVTRKPRDTEQSVFRFRVQHRPLGAYNPDSIMGEYLFLQMLDDFLGDSSFPFSQMEEKYILALLSIAFLIPQKLPLSNSDRVDPNYSIPPLRRSSFFSFTSRFSKALKKSLKLSLAARRYWVLVSLIDNIKTMKEDRLTLHDYKETFYEFLVKSVPDYCFEYYQVQVLSGPNPKPVSAVLRLDQTAEKNGLYYGQELECLMSDIESMALIKPQNLEKRTWEIVVRLGNGAAKALQFEEEEAAESFLSTAQRLVKLCLRWDFVLCHEKLTRAEHLDLHLRSFGPLFPDTAKLYLEDLTTTPEFANLGFLIYQSSSEFRHYTVLACRQTNDKDLQFEHFIIALACENRLLLKPLHEEREVAQEFMNYAELRSYLLNRFCLQALPNNYQKKSDISEEYKTEIDPEGKIAVPMILDREEKTPRFFLEKDLNNESPIEDKNIRIRKFEVTYKNKRMMKVQVANTEEGDAEAFREGLERFEDLRRIKPQIFLELYNLVLCRHLTLVAEAPDHGDLLTYICKNPQTPSEKVELMVHIVNALKVMHDCKHYHGNIRSRKFLVFNAGISGVKIKLEYPGITSMLDTWPLDNELNLERLGWLSPERRDNLRHVTYESECYAVGTTLAEMIYRSDSFTEVINLRDNKELKTYLATKKQLPSPIDLPWKGDIDEDGIPLLTSTDQLWKAVWETAIVPCWADSPSLRPLPDTLLASFDELRRQARDLPKEDFGEETKLVSYGDLGIPEDEEVTDPVTREELCKVLKDCNKDFSPDQLTITQTVLGKGCFGIVRKGLLKQLMQHSWDEIEQPVAIKQCFLGEGFQEDSFYKEISIASRLEHDNIVKMIAAGPIKREHSSGHSQLVLISEFMDGGSLEKYLSHCDPKKAEHARDLLRICHDVVQGMVYLQGNNIVHRDLAPRNVLLKKQSCGMKAKVSDFGLSRTMDKNYTFYRIKTKDQPVPWPIWPPECLVDFFSDSCFSSQGDVWSFGVLLWKVFTKGNVMREISDGWNRQFGDSRARVDLVKDHSCHKKTFRLFESGWRLPQKPPITADLYKVMQDCWGQEPSSRPPFVNLAQRISNVNLLF